MADTGLITDVGENIGVEYLVNRDSPENLVLRLFQNDFTPDEETTGGDLTEADFSGYSAQTLSGGSWSAASEGSTSFAEQSFTADESIAAAQTIYGWYMTRASGGEVVAAGRFSNPPTLEAEGDTVKVTPTITAAGA